MKKVAAILLAIMMMVSLIACAKTDVPAADTKTESQPAAQNDAAPKKEETPAAPAFPTKPITMNLTGKPGSGTESCSVLLALRWKPKPDAQ